MSGCHLDWTMSNYNIIACLLILPTFKLFRLPFRKPPLDERTLFYFFGPCSSKESLALCVPANRNLLLQRLRHYAHFALIGVIMYWILVTTQRRFQLSWFMLSYAAAPLLYVWSEANGAVVQVIFGILAGRIPGSIHRSPLRARSVGDFWGSRWNIWMRDCLYTFVFSPLRRRQHLALATVFLVSGMIHEVVLNLPLYLFLHRNLFGSQIGYFAIQYAGFSIDRKYLRPFPKFRIFFLWFVVLLPAPLILNVGMLHTLHIL